VSPLPPVSYAYNVAVPQPKAVVLIVSVQCSLLCDDRKRSR